jgi:hemerythrin superfamily protein
MSSETGLRSIADEPESALGGPGSVFARQRRDHQRLDALLDRIERSAGAEQDAALQDTYRLVFPHAFAEEAVIWPLMRRVLPDGERLTLEVEQEHQEINELLAAVDRGRRQGDGREEALARAVALLREDVRDEEDVLFPRLRDHLDDGELRRLGRTWEAVRRIAPTRPHPVVARRPPGNVLSALPLSAIDRTRDTLNRAARHRRGPLGAPVHRLDRTLAAAAGRIERLPGVRHGEDPSTATGRTDAEPAEQQRP